MIILSSFTQSQVVSKPVWMSLFCWTQRKIFWRMWENRAALDHSICFPTEEVNGVPKQPGYKLSSKYLPLYSAEQRNSYRFGTTWGWVNDDRIFIFGWTILLSLQAFPLSLKHTMHCILQTRVKHQWNINTYNSFILTQWAFSFECQSLVVKLHLCLILS